MHAGLNACKLHACDRFRDLGWPKAHTAHVGETLKLARAVYNARRVVRGQLKLPHSIAHPRRHRHSNTQNRYGHVDCKQIANCNLSHAGGTKAGGR